MNVSLHRTVFLLVMISWLAAACAASRAAQAGQAIQQTPAPATPTSDLTFEQLKNTTYTLPDAPDGAITLVDGQGQQPYAPDSATQFKVILQEPAAFGDLDGKGEADATAILLADPGGSGSFYYLTAVLNQAGKLQPTAPVLLGDRIEVQSLTIAGGEISVTYLDRQPGEPFSAKPSQEVTKTYRLQNGQLLETG
jgi:hypothetical protein